MEDFGGEMRLIVPSIGPIKMRGHFTVMPSNIEVEGGSNMDKTQFRKYKPVGNMCDLKSLSASDEVDWKIVLDLPRQNITIIEDRTGRAHVFINAFLEGKVDIDYETGEVSGLKIRADNYVKTNG